SKPTCRQGSPRAHALPRGCLQTGFTTAAEARNLPSFGDLLNARHRYRQGQALDPLLLRTLEAARANELENFSRGGGNIGTRTENRSNTLVLQHLMVLRGNDAADHDENLVGLFLP